MWDCDFPSNLVRHSSEEELHVPFLEFLAAGRGLVGFLTESKIITPGFHCVASLLFQILIDIIHFKQDISLEYVDTYVTKYSTTDIN